jgi:hypothetical protein
MLCTSGVVPASFLGWVASEGGGVICGFWGGGLDWSYCGVGEGGTNRSDIGLNLSGSWQQGHSATYNTPSRI